jgi:hypothetical protein
VLLLTRREVDHENNDEIVYEERITEGGRWMLLLLLLSSAVRLNFRLDDVDLKLIPFFMYPASCFNCTWIDGCSFRVFWQQQDDGDQLNIN